MMMMMMMMMMMTAILAHVPAILHRAILQILHREAILHRAILQILHREAILQRAILQILHREAILQRESPKTKIQNQEYSDPSDGDQLDHQTTAQIQIKAHHLHRALHQLVKLQLNPKSPSM
jgi:hypothetical protein